MVEQLRPRQQAIMRFIEDFLDENGYPPTVRDIQYGCNISSTSVVDYNLKGLVRGGFLRRSKEVSRGIEVVGRRERERGVTIPVLGAIAAGEPLPVFPQDVATALEEDSMEIDTGMATKAATKEKLFALHVKGDSMIDALIRDGDMVVLEAQESAEPGEMVAAWLVQEEEATLKRFFPEGERVRLQPENTTMSAIYVDARNVQIRGRVVGVLRRYE
ncbi:MAG: transcriptional repressor LexA [Dehalococcoidia bacterium]|nr:transcriptional repressor LexA [Dehalococcoidia bacterium]